MNTIVQEYKSTRVQEYNLLGFGLILLCWSWSVLVDLGWFFFYFFFILDDFSWSGLILFFFVFFTLLLLVDLSWSWLILIYLCWSGLILVDLGFRTVVGATSLKIIIHKKNTFYQYFRVLVRRKSSVLLICQGR